MTSDSVYDDPIWEYVLATKIQPYIPAAKKWWDKYDKLEIKGTGVFDYEYDVVEDKNVPPGLMIRVTSTPVRSPIKNVQAFPFVPAAYLQISGVPGGVNRMIERVCKDGLEIDGVTIVEKHNLPSTYHKGQILAFIPTDVLAGSYKLGKYMYLTLVELVQMSRGNLPQSVITKCYQYAK